ncbi:hypothetical protein GWO43_17460 [candidate division KSB1 bacterium]|nr:hypothetical protein [candidate division KSB1 bacterium]NIR71774.1 hypothetical protein [candidate division KSB1 bacterium]NIS25756.1 hypothetical protein [candidate division KSB1 bacterium]NIT72625.1 hypothetical protein [candidate division KSB1 bacterium]NIU26446.1 hypothetical protein [candidate division KSB1 bacterium]
MKESTLLTADAIINLVLGLPLLLVPDVVFGILKLPIGESLFLPTVLGGILIGIGIALLIERFRDSLGLAGLGLEGAIVINVFGAGALATWLVRDGSNIPTLGYSVLWMVAAAVLGVSIIESFTKLKQRTA